MRRHGRRGSQRSERRYLREGFREAIHLPGFFVYEEERAATLCYDDGELFGGHGIVLTVAADGRYTQQPEIVG